MSLFRCPKFDELPAECRLITDPYNPCCKKAYCPADKVPTPAPPGASTQAPTPLSRGKIALDTLEENRHCLYV